MGFIDPYPTKNPIRRGYAVATPDIDPGDKQWNGRFINERGQRIYFWIEEIEANFSMGGTTAQSRTLRQFFPHNMVQPTITVKGRAPNSYQYNRLANFIRVSHSDSVSARELKGAGINLRTEKLPDGSTSVIPTLQFTIRAGITGKYPFSGRTVKGKHKAWKLEGYVKSMPSGAQRFNHAPPFQFDFLIAESLKAENANIGIWSDTAVQGDLIKPWIDIFKANHENGFTSPGKTATDVGETLQGGGGVGDIDS